MGMDNGDRTWMSDHFEDIAGKIGGMAAKMDTLTSQNMEQFDRIAKIEQFGCAQGRMHTKLIDELRLIPGRAAQRGAIIGGGGIAAIVALAKVAEIWLGK